MRAYLSIHATSDSSLVREDTLQGKDYLVVPVVAVVEGVLQGANSPEPELATAAEFGKNLPGWNGRPVVMNHPQDGTGNYVSANSPEIISDWAMGAMYAAYVEDSKLKVEAWIDIARAKELGGEFESTYDRLVAGEQVEVSVGIFVNVIKRPGVYKGKKYSAIWSDVVPDHLALLSAGAIGACSVEDGCGAPRVNGLKMATVATPVTAIQVPPPPSSAGGTAVKPLAVAATECGCHDTPADAIAVPPAPDSINESIEAARRLSARFSINALPADRFNSDIYKAICAAIRKKFGYSAYAYGYTTDYAVYEYYDFETGAACYKIGISVDENLVVSFTSEPTEVKVVMQIIDSPEEEDTMTVATAPAPTTGEIAPVVTEPVVAAASAAAPILPTPAAPITPQARQLTVEEYIASAPAGLREVLAESVRVHETRKNDLVQQLLSTNRCSFSEGQLKDMTFETLQGLAQLADIRDFSGQGFPRAVPQAPAGGQSSMSVQAAPQLWPQPTPAA